MLWDYALVSWRTAETLIPVMGSIPRNGKTTWLPQMRRLKLSLAAPAKRRRSCPQVLGGLPALCRWQDSRSSNDSGFVDDFFPNNAWYDEARIKGIKGIRSSPILCNPPLEGQRSLPAFSSVPNMDDNHSLNDSGTCMTFDGEPSEASPLLVMGSSNGSPNDCFNEHCLMRLNSDVDQDSGIESPLDHSLVDCLDQHSPGYKYCKIQPYTTVPPRRRRGSKSSELYQHRTESASWQRLMDSQVLAGSLDSLDQLDRLPQHPAVNRRYMSPQLSPADRRSMPNLMNMSLSTSPVEPESPPESPKFVPPVIRHPSQRNIPGLRAVPVNTRAWPSSPTRRKILAKLPPTPRIIFDIRDPVSEYARRHAKTKGKYEKRPESLVVSDSDGKKTSKLAGSSSITSIVSQTSTEKSTKTSGGRAASWALSFDKLLADRAGLAAFTEFLKKEFSEENIIFWTECEKYKAITNGDERKAFGSALFERHLGKTASDPVNVDSMARQTATENMGSGDQDVFSLAQLQIFTLMRQDSYPRFLKSDLYKQCVVAEMEGKALPFGPPQEKKEDKKAVKFLDLSMLSVDSHKSRLGQILKKSKSVSSAEEPAEEKRRKSLLPWSRNKSEKRLSKLASESSDSEKSASRRSMEEDKQEEKINFSSQDNKFCRAMLPDGSTTVIFARPGPSIYNSLSKLCERRNMMIASMEVFLLDSEKPLDLLKDISTLGSKEIKLERRVLIRVELPNRKVIGVRARPNRVLRDVLRPILLKYGYKVESIVIQITGSSGLVDPDCQMQQLDNQRISIQTSQDFAEWGGFGTHRHLGKPPLPRSKSTTADPTDPHLLLADIMDGKPEQVLQFDELGVFDPERKVEEHHKRAEESHKSGLFGFMRRNSWGEKEGSKMKSRLRMSSQPSSQQQQPRPPKGRGRDPDDEKFFELLTRVQSHRLDDQRGLTARDLELPDFLKDKPSEEANQRRRSSESPGDLARWRRRGERRNSDSSLMDISPDNRRLSKSLSQDALEADVDPTGSTATPTQGPQRIPYMDQSFHDGTVPAHTDAENYFSHGHTKGSPNFNDSRAMERSLQDIGLSAHQRQASLDSALASRDPRDPAVVRCTTPISALPARLSPRAKTPSLGASTGNRPPMQRSPRLESRDPVNTTILCASGIDLDTTGQTSTDVSHTDTIDPANCPAPLFTRTQTAQPRVPPRRTVPIINEPGQNNSAASMNFSQSSSGSHGDACQPGESSPPPRPPPRTNTDVGQAKKILVFEEKTVSHV